MLQKDIKKGKDLRNMEQNEWNSNQLKEKFDKILSYYESDGSNITYDQTMQDLINLFDQAIQKAREDIQKQCLDENNNYTSPDAERISDYIDSLFPKKGNEI